MNTHPIKASPGFSLIELLVVIGIFTIISTVVLANHAKFNGSVLLGSLAYDMALSVRQAQVFGLSVREFSGNFQIGYGIHITGSSEYFLFADTNGNQKYDEGTDSIVENFRIERGHRIAEFCGYTASGTPACSTSPTPITYLDIVFNRPDPDAIMSSNEPGVYSRSTITVQSPGGDTRTVEVASTGQISVQNP